MDTVKSWWQTIYCAILSVFIAETEIKKNLTAELKGSFVFSLLHNIFIKLNCLNKNQIA